MSIESEYREKMPEGCRADCSELNRQLTRAESSCEPEARYARSCLDALVEVASEIECGGRVDVGDRYPQLACRVTGAS